jgi:hypothetical protein
VTIEIYILNLINEKTIIILLRSFQMQMLLLQLQKYLI